MTTQPTDVAGLVALVAYYSQRGHDDLGIGEVERLLNAAASLATALTAAEAKRVEAEKWAKDSDAKWLAAEARATAAEGERDEARERSVASITDELAAEVRADAAEAEAASWKADAASEFTKRQEAEARLALAVKGLEEIERHWLASAHPFVGYIARTTLTAIRSGDGSSLSPEPMPIGWNPTHRHVGRGTEYQVVMRFVELQASAGPIEEGALLVVYQGQDGKLWARRALEFEDGRFVALAPPSPPCGANSEVETAKAAVEQRAREIYESWSDQPDFVPWVVAGNSLKQEAARRLARADPCAQDSDREGGGA